MRFSLVAVVGALLLALAFARDARQAWVSYLTAYTFALTLVQGVLILLLSVHAMNATWPLVVRRLCEAVVATLPLFAALFVPIAMNLRAIYPWAVDPSRVHRLAWFGVALFYARAAAYFVVWCVAALLLRRWSLADDRLTHRPPSIGRARSLAAASLPAVGLAMTFSAIDWWMSLAAPWFSTMYGLYTFAGGFLAALALITLLLLDAERRGAIAATLDHYYALGRLLLSFTIFWAYIAFFQLLLIWIADRPDESIYYLRRAHGGWRGVSWLLALGQFAAPFFALLPYPVKRSRRALLAIAGWLLLMHFVDALWLIAPEARQDRSPLQFGDLGALLFFVGLSGAVAVALARGHALLPVGDPRLSAALRYQPR
jgi:hypothetical protein